MSGAGCHVRMSELCRTVGEVVPERWYRMEVPGVRGTHGDGGASSENSFKGIREYNLAKSL